MAANARTILKDFRSYVEIMEHGLKYAPGLGDLEPGDFIKINDAVEDLMNAIDEVLAKLAETSIPAELVGKLIYKERWEKPWPEEAYPALAQRRLKELLKEEEPPMQQLAEAALLRGALAFHEAAKRLREEGEEEAAQRAMEYFRWVNEGAARERVKTVFFEDLVKDAIYTCRREVSHDA